MAVSPLLVAAFVAAVLMTGHISTLPLGRIVIASVVVTMVLYATAVGYFLYVVQTEATFDSSDKARWTFTLLMFFPFAAIWFWYQFIWRARRAQG